MSKKQGKGVTGLLLALLVLVGACQQPVLAPQPTLVPPTEIPTATPTPAPPLIVGATKNYFGLAAGRHLVYLRHGGALQRVEMSGPDKTIWPGHLLWRVRSSFSKGSTLQPVTELEELSGANLLLAGTIRSSDLRLYTPPYLLLKAPTTVGDMYTTVTALAGSNTRTMTVSYTVAASEPVTVLAGSYMAYRLEYTRATQLPDGSASIVQLTEWFVPNVGIVKIVSSTDSLYNAELVSVR